MSKVIYKIPVKQYTYGNGKVEIWHRGKLSMRYYSRTGKFNLLSDEISVSCHVAVYEDDKRLLSCNISPEDEYEGTDVDEAAWLINEDIKSHWIDTASSEKKAVRKFILRHQEEIEMGNGVKRLIEIDKELERLKSEKESLLRWVTQ